MGLTGEAKKEYQRKYMKAKRSNTGSNKTEGLTEDVNPSEVAANPGNYPAIVVALVDPVKRFRLERINAELQRKGLGQCVTYGWQGPDFNIIDSFLKATS